MTRSSIARQAIAQQSAERGLYAAGLSTRDIRAYLEEVYGLKVSAALVSRVTDAILLRCQTGKTGHWNQFILSFFSMLSGSKSVMRKAVRSKTRRYTWLWALLWRVNARSCLWIATNEGATFWLSIMNNLRNRGVEDILIAVVDGLKGFPGTITRSSLNFCGWKDRKKVAKSLKRIYQATDDTEAEKALDDFETEWGKKYPSIAPSWRRAWQEVIPFFAFPPAVRKIIYTTNAIESLNRVIRKTTKTCGSFPTDDAAIKPIYLAIRKFENTG